ncbi:hypothetical protein KIH74_18210 [Kineosporia sp. J2-2]|uniref:DUF4352 domain-containing protein n=1 Tax=Kineosporia corallincola TaxID=2835133 RepID=A0ABS5TKJ3_9ACTN|nr:hypothetical protein [Kineosporia corallincola]MBT0770879.1 hypothetical protein [Kineosporia corallincola]
MTDDDRKRRTPERADSRGGPAAMLSALVAAGLIFAAAIMLHFGSLPPFLMPAVSPGDEATIEGALTVGAASQDVTLVASVPDGPKISGAKPDGETERKTVTVAVRVENRSTVAVDVPGGEQTLRTGLARSYDSTTTDTVTVAPGKTKTVKLKFVVPETEDPASFLLKVAGEQRKFDVS